MLLRPVGLKFGWSEIPQRRMNTLVLVDLLREMSDLSIGIGKVLIVGKVDLFLMVLMLRGRFAPTA
jgi:hypothetical protein